MIKIYIVRSEITPTESSEMYKMNPKAIGAFVDCIVPATNKDEAIEKAKITFLEDGYKVIKIRECDAFEEFNFEEKDLEIEYKAMAWDAHFNELIGYGPFHCYYEKEEIEEN